MKEMKRIPLKHGSAHVDKDVSPETVEALNKMCELAYEMASEPLRLSDVVESSFEIVDAHKEFVFNNACPYCKCRLTYVAEGWEEDDNGQWMVDSFDMQCSSEPDMDKTKEWEEWFTVHSQMPYVHQLPVDTKVKNWINSKYRFKLD